MPTSDEIVYLDSSAIVKLIVQESETTALRTFLTPFQVLTSSVLARVEVSRAVARLGVKGRDRAERVLDRLLLLRLDTEILERAAWLPPPLLRTLEAIHLASAQTFGSQLRTIVTYDTRMAGAAGSLGLPVDSPR